MSLHQKSKYSVSCVWRKKVQVSHPSTLISPLWGTLTPSEPEPKGLSSCTLEKVRTQRHSWSGSFTQAPPLTYHVLPSGICCYPMFSVMNSKCDLFATLRWCFFWWGWQTLAWHVTILLDCRGPRCTLSMELHNEELIRTSRLCSLSEEWKGAVFTRKHWTSCLNFPCLSLLICKMSSLYLEIITIRSWVLESFLPAPHSDVQRYLLSASYVPVTAPGTNSTYR